MATTSLSHEAISAIAHPLAAASGSMRRRYPGDRPDRQPVHVVYGGAHLFRPDTPAKLGAQAARALEAWAPSADALARALGLESRLPGPLAATIYDRVREKLAREPVEDFRIDFEDGYGHRADEEEDGHAEAAAAAAAEAFAAGALPYQFGIRIKPLTDDLRDRSVRTLDIFVTALAAATGGRLPPNLVVTLPKVTIPEEVAALGSLLDLLEVNLGLRRHALRIELMIETPRAVVDERGEAGVLRLVDAARGRCSGVHFGPYDYTASCGITAACQRLHHPACDFARRLMQVSLAGTGVWLSDGPTNVLPVPLHRPAEGRPLAPGEEEANRRTVQAAWRLHHDDIRRSLEHGFYQGWDLHPAQLVSRYAAVFGFFHEGIEAASGRLRAFVRRAARATLVGDVFDDAASGQGLLNYFLRAMNCGALTDDEVEERTGLEAAEIRGRSFLEIAKARR